MEYYYLKTNIHDDSDLVEVFFCDSGFAPLYKSHLRENTFYPFCNDFSVGDISNVDYEIDIDSNKKIRIWTSRLSVQEYLNFLYFCHKFQGEISVVFVDDYSKYVRSLGVIAETEIEELLKFEKILTKEEIVKFQKEWKKLVKENSEMRVFEDKIIKSVDYSYLDEYITKTIHDNPTADSKRLIGALMGNDEVNNFSDYVYKFLLDRYLQYHS